MKDLPLRPDDLLELFEIDLTAIAAPETARAEPVLATAPFPGEFDEPDRPDPRRLDPGRSDTAWPDTARPDTARFEAGRLDPGRAQAEPAKLPPPRRRPGLSLAMLGSLGLHLLPLLALLPWGSAPAEIAVPIPVQLVLEAAPPLPPVPEKKPPPPGRLASEDIGETQAKPDQPAETQIAAALPPPKPIPPPDLLSALPKPAPEPDPAARPEEPNPALPVKPPVKQAVVARLVLNPHPAPRAQVPGTAATRDEYLAYCATLIRGHFGLLPPSFVAGRRGATVLNILVLDDGTIARISVARNSSYPDIDARIEQAVAAVRRFPPLPQWFQGPRISLTLQVSYPEGL